MPLLYAIRHHDVGMAAGNATVPAVEILRRIPDGQFLLAPRRRDFGGLVSRLPAAPHQRRSPLALGGQLWKFPVRRIDDHRRLTLGERGIARAALQRNSQTPFPRRERRDCLRGGIAGLADAQSPVHFSLIDLGRLEQWNIVRIARRSRRRGSRCRDPATRTAASRTTAARACANEVQTVCDRPHASEVRIAPRGARMDPALRCFDEMVGLACARLLRAGRYVPARSHRHRSGGAHAKHARLSVFDSKAIDRFYFRHVLCCVNLRRCTWH